MTDLELIQEELNDKKLYLLECAKTQSVTMTDMAGNYYKVPDTTMSNLVINYTPKKAASTLTTMYNAYLRKEEFTDTSTDQKSLEDFYDENY